MPDQVGRRGTGSRSLWRVWRRSIGLMLSVTATVALLPQPTQAATTVTASLVNTVLLSQLSPPSPDPSGIVYIPNQDRLLVADSEVEEMSIWSQVNLWRIERDGDLSDTGNLRSFTKEPTGLGFDPATGRLFISDDSAKKVFIVLPGSDGRYGTSDDTHTSFSTSAFGNTDPEDVAFSTSTGELFTADGLADEIYRISPGLNGAFDGVPPTGDDVVSHFDVGGFGVLNSEGLGYLPSRNTLLVVDGRSTNQFIYEVTLGGTLVTSIDISAANAKHPEDVAIAPGTQGGAQNFYMVARGVDNNGNPNENDGKMYEFVVNLSAPGNQAPVVSAGPDVTVTHPNAASLNGSVTDDGLPNPPGAVTSQWSKVSGPGAVTFANASSPVTTATFSTAGTYVLRLTASDSVETRSDDVTVTSSVPGSGTVLDVAVSAGSDDAEETVSGAVLLASGDLEMVLDDGANQTVGIRFAGIAVPQGATIVNAYVQFTVQGTPTRDTTLTIQGEAADNPGTFTTSAFNVSSRSRTSASVSWVVPVWSTIGQAGSDQRTPNLGAVIQQVVSRPGWSSGNALAFIITGSGRRVARSFNSGSGAPVLHVEYTV